MCYGGCDCQRCNPVGENLVTQSAWTRERPTTAGWYWWRKGPGYSKNMAAIFYDEPRSEWRARFLMLNGEAVGTLPIDVCDGEWQAVKEPEA